jgi:hypothetical protein
MNMNINPLDRLAQRVGAEVNKTVAVTPRSAGAPAAPNYSQSGIDEMTGTMSAVLAALRLPQPQVYLIV